MKPQITYTSVADYTALQAAIAETDAASYAITLQLKDKDNYEWQESSYVSTSDSSKAILTTSILKADNEWTANPTVYWNAEQGTKIIQAQAKFGSDDEIDGQYNDGKVYQLVEGEYEEIDEGDITYGEGENRYFLLFSVADTNNYYGIDSVYREIHLELIKAKKPEGTDPDDPLDPEIIVLHDPTDPDNPEKDIIFKWDPDIGSFVAYVDYVGLEYEPDVDGIVTSQEVTIGEDTTSIEVYEVKVVEVEAGENPYAQSAWLDAGVYYINLVPLDGIAWEGEEGLSALETFHYATLVIRPVDLTLALEINAAINYQPYANRDITDFITSEDIEEDGYEDYYKYYETYYNAPIQLSFNVLMLDAVEPDEFDDHSMNKYGSQSDLNEAYISSYIEALADVIYEAPAEYNILMQYYLTSKPLEEQYWFGNYNVKVLETVLEVTKAYPDTKREVGLTSYVFKDSTLVYDAEEQGLAFIPKPGTIQYSVHYYSVSEEEELMSGTLPIDAGKYIGYVLFKGTDSLGNDFDDPTYYYVDYDDYIELDSDDYPTAVLTIKKADVNLDFRTISEHPFDTNHPYLASDFDFEDGDYLAQTTGYYERDEIEEPYIEYYFNFLEGTSNENLVFKKYKNYTLTCGSNYKFNLYKRIEIEIPSESGAGETETQVIYIQLPNTYSCTMFTDPYPDDDSIFILCPYDESYLAKQNAPLFWLEEDSDVESSYVEEGAIIAVSMNDYYSGTKVFNYIESNFDMYTPNTYTLLAHQVEYDNYNEAYALAEYLVTKARVVITLKDNDWLDDGNVLRIWNGKETGVFDFDKGEYISTSMWYKLQGLEIEGYEFATDEDTLHIVWYGKDPNGEFTVELDEAPSDVGEYQLGVSLDEQGEYQASPEVRQSFKIGKLTDTTGEDGVFPVVNHLNSDFDTFTKTYDGACIDPTFSISMLDEHENDGLGAYTYDFEEEEYTIEYAPFGDITSWSSSKPINANQYIVKITIPETANHAELVAYYEGGYVYVNGVEVECPTVEIFKRKIEIIIDYSDDGKYADLSINDEELENGKTISEEIGTYLFDTNAPDSCLDLSAELAQIFPICSHPAEDFYIFINP